MLRATSKSLEKAKTLAPVHPNQGTQAIFRRRLDKLIKEMHDSVMYWVKASYKANEPEIAQDELPAAALQKVLKKLGRRWEKKFKELGPKLAEYYAKSADMRSRKQLEQMLYDHGMSVKFKMTRPMQDVMKASIEEQVKLISNIPQQYFTQVQGAVMRSVQTGRDLNQLSKDLQSRLKIEKKRAALIARDQNNKMTANFVRVRQQELGIKQAIWVHSLGGKVPRPSHKKNDGKPYDVEKGWYDPDEGEYIQPGMLINCRCVSRSIIPGFE